MIGELNPALHNRSAQFLEKYIAEQETLNNNFMALMRQ